MTSAKDACVAKGNSKPFKACVPISAGFTKLCGPYKDEKWDCAPVRLRILSLQAHATATAVRGQNFLQALWLLFGRLIDDLTEAAVHRLVQPGACRLWFLQLSGRFGPRPRRQAPRGVRVTDSHT